MIDLVSIFHDKTFVSADVHSYSTMMANVHKNIPTLVLSICVFLNIQFLEVSVWKNPSLSFWMLPLRYIVEYFVQNNLYYSTITSENNWRYHREVNEKVLYFVDK